MSNEDIATTNFEKKLSALLTIDEAPKIGKKFDQGKTQYHLMPLTALEKINQVLMHGAIKYGEHNWRTIDKLEERYFNAAMRHLLAWLGDELVDAESGLPHLAHAATSIMFLIENDLAAEKS